MSTDFYTFLNPSLSAQRLSERSVQHGLKTGLYLEVVVMTVIILTTIA
jgi:hypothetical protein